MKSEIRLFSMLFIVLTAAQMVRADEGGKEIGFVESFDRKAEEYVIHRGKEDLPVAIMAPIETGDRIEVRDPTAKIVLKLLNHATPVIISRSNLDTPLSDTPPSRTFWTPLIAWAAKQVDIFDHEEREQVSASIRNSAGAGLSAPLLSAAQTLPAGHQSIAVGWTGPARVDVHLYDAANKEITSGRGADKLWLSEQLQLSPGDYVLDLSVGTAHVRQKIVVVPPTAMPDLPLDLVREDIPEQLREVATGAWLAARDRRLMLAGLQHVAPLARDFQPAKLLARALIRGERPEMQP
jgi:hypothetical protein